MKPNELKLLLERTRIKEAGQEAAHLVLVKGLSCAEASRRIGKSRAYVQQIVTRIEKEKKRFLRCPDGHRLITICVTEEQERAIRAIIDK